MGIKPGPKRIADSTGKPDRRQRDNKNTPGNTPSLKPHIHKPGEKKWKRLKQVFKNQTNGVPDTNGDEQLNQTAAELKERQEMFNFQPEISKAVPGQTSRTPGTPEHSMLS